MVGMMFLLWLGKIFMSCLFGLNGWFRVKLRFVFKFLMIFEIRGE